MQNNEYQFTYFHINETLTLHLYNQFKIIEMMEKKHKQLSLYYTINKK